MDVTVNNITHAQHMANYKQPWLVDVLTPPRLLTLSRLQEHNIPWLLKIVLFGVDDLLVLDGLVILALELGANLGHLL